MRREGLRQVSVSGRDFQDAARPSGTNAPGQGAQKSSRRNEVDGAERIELADLLEFPAPQRGDDAIEGGRRGHTALAAFVPEEPRHVEAASPS